jgi:hypothetical protein
MQMTALPRLSMLVMISFLFMGIPQSADCLTGKPDRRLGHRSLSMLHFES